MDSFTESKIQYFWDAAMSLPPNSEINMLIKSHYLQSCFRYQRTFTKLQNQQFGCPGMCQKCGMPWMDGQYSMKLEPQKICKTAKIVKLLDAYKNNKNDLTRKQKIRAKWYKKKSTSFLVTKCNLCNKRSKYPLDKPKSDKHCAIKKEIKENCVILPKKPEPERTTSVKVPMKSQNMLKKKSKKAPAVKSVQNKVIPQKDKKMSDTQKNKDLLKLAAMLKKSSENNSNTKKSSNRLEALLK